MNTHTHCSPTLHNSVLAKLLTDPGCVKLVHDSSAIGVFVDISPRDEEEETWANVVDVQLVLELLNPGQDLNIR